VVREDVRPEADQTLLLASSIEEAMSATIKRVAPNRLKRRTSRAEKIFQREKAVRRARNQNYTEKQQVRTDKKRVVMKRAPQDIGGTALTGLVKMQSEEARHMTCPECGFSSGRHLRICSRL
jgi:hypothetical protein